MKQREHKDLFVYTAQKEYSPFTFFLNHTDEKENLSSFLAKEITVQARQKPIRVLDVGCGDASLVGGAIARSKEGLNIEYTGIEPAIVNVKSAQKNLQKLNIKGKIVHDYFSAEKLQRVFDISIASNLYHLEMHEVPEFLRHLGRATSSSGFIYFIYRGKDDDILRFRQRFEPQLHSNYKQPRTIDDVTHACRGKISHTTLETVHSKLTFPESREEKEQLFEFILNVGVKQLDKDFIDRLHRYVDQKSGIFHTQQVAIKIKGMAQ